MSEPTQPAAPGPEHAFQVTSKTFATSERSAWSQVQSADLTAAEAVAWIEQRQAEAADLGLVEIPSASAQLAADLADQAAPPAAAADQAAPPAAADPAAAGAQLLPGT